MNQLASYYINEYYINKNFKTFKEKSAKTPKYICALDEITKSLCKEQTVCNLTNFPAIEIWMKFDSYKLYTFSVKYLSLLRISKVSDLFVIQHEFSVDNIDPNRMTPVLDGFGEESYTLQQKRAEEQICSFLRQQGLTKLSLSEMDEVVCDLSLKEQSIFGTQMTLENALFRDLYSICDS